jgi:20S proteasome alpha/beta subunit
MTIDELCSLAGFAISETATQDLRVGGNIKMVKILPEGATFLTEKQIKECIDKCLSRS